MGDLMGDLIKLLNQRRFESVNHAHSEMQNLVMEHVRIGESENWTIGELENLKNQTI
jgi:hypothetical protein